MYDYSLYLFVNKHEYVSVIRIKKDALTLFKLDIYLIIYLQIKHILS